MSGNGVGTRVSADQYASDTIFLHDIVQDIYKDVEPKPLIISPGGFFDAAWFKGLINKASSSIDVVTHHIYNLGPGATFCLRSIHFAETVKLTFSSIQCVKNQIVPASWNGPPRMDNSQYDSLKQKNKLKKT